MDHRSRMNAAGRAWLSSILFIAACGSGESTLPTADGTSGDEDLSLAAQGRRVEAEVRQAAVVEVPSSKASVPSAVPKLSAVEDAPLTASEGAMLWGAPDAETGTPLPERTVLSGNAASSYADGGRALEERRLDDARRAFSRALSTDPKAYQAEYGLGIVADRKGNADEALGHYARALQIQPDYEDAAKGTVSIWLRRGSPQEAVRFVEPLARKWQRNLALQALYADTLVSADRVDQAEQVARAALQRDERYAPAVVSLAKASARRGRYELSDSTLEQAHELDPNNAEVYFLQGKRLQQRGELAQALASYRKAVELNPDYAEARMAVGIQAMASGNYEEANEQFEAVVSLVPNLPAGHLNLGDAYRALRRWQDAKNEFDRALRLQARLPEAHYDLGLLYMAVGKDFPNLSELDALAQSLNEFNTYRSQIGAKLPPDDMSGSYMADIQRRIDREKKRIEREKSKAAKDAERKARGQQ